MKDDSFDPYDPTKLDEDGNYPENNGEGTDIYDEVAGHLNKRKRKAVNNSNAKQTTLDNVLDNSTKQPILNKVGKSTRQATLYEFDESVKQTTLYDDFKNIKKSKKSEIALGE
ncbi:MAG: hypothetical protein IJ837_03195 [Clostridia bacterium]|nr:hypothetical protein [Clostridia bacterium]